MVRKVLGAVVGIAIAVVTVALVEMISHAVFPPPADLDVSDSESLATYMRQAPVGALLLVVAGYLIGTFDGVFIGALIGRGKPAAYAALIGLLMLVATIANLIMIPHPFWFQAAAVIGIPLAALAGMLAIRAVLRKQGHVS